MYEPLKFTSFFDNAVSALRVCFLCLSTVFFLRAELQELSRMLLCLRPVPLTALRNKDLQLYGLLVRESNVLPTGGHGCHRETAFSNGAIYFAPGRDSTRLSFRLLIHSLVPCSTVTHAETVLG